MLTDHGNMGDVAISAIPPESRRISGVGCGKLARFFSPLEERSLGAILFARDALDVHNISCLSCSGEDVEEGEGIYRGTHLPQAVVVIVRVRARVSRDLFLLFQE